MNANADRLVGEAMEQAVLPGPRPPDTEPDETFAAPELSAWLGALHEAAEALAATAAWDEEALRLAMGPDVDEYDENGVVIEWPEWKQLLCSAGFWAEDHNASPEETARKVVSRTRIGIYSSLLHPDRYSRADAVEPLARTPVPVLRLARDELMRVVLEGDGGSLGDLDPREEAEIDSRLVDAIAAKGQS